ncbi:MAG: glycosyltransferase family 2 protein [Acidobacteria bacterium]|nr:glycosyltransferase family 2 protein [Acidobacteriota bacterium]
MREPGGRRSEIDSVDVLVVSWNGRHHLETLLPVLETQQVPGATVKVRLFDNGSTDDTVGWVRSAYPWVDVVAHPGNIGFSAANNRLAAESSASALALVNNDTRPQSDWLAELVTALRQAPPDVAALSGCIVDWDGSRLDFGRGVMTFDGHAFQLDYHRPMADVELPEEGGELLFPCGGNMIVRRDSYLAAGGFDETYFAYLEDVDLGWRLWSAGERVLTAPRAVVHHRSMATSQLLGNANRGLLFERNAYLTVFKNYDSELWPKLMPVVQMTLLARIQHLLAYRNPYGHELAVDPYSAREEGWAGAPARTVTSADDPSGVWRTVLDSGAREAWEQLRSVVALRTRLRRFLRPQPELPDGVPAIVDEQTVAQVRALSSIVRGLDGAVERRRRIQVRRCRPDAEIFERFPLYVVPTYPGDEQLFESVGFESLWPEEVMLVRRSLEDVMEVEQ